MRDFADRRTVLRSGLAACTASLAGCLEGLTGDGDDGSPPAENGTDGDDDSGTDDDSEPEPVAAWPSFQNDAGNTGYAEGRAPSDNLEIEWEFKARKDVGTNEHDEIRGGPVISEDGIAYIGAEDRAFYAIDIEDGSLVWSTELPRRSWQTPLLYDDLIVVSITGGVKAYDRHAGDLQWTFSIKEDRTPTPPVEQNGTIVVGTGEKKIYGIDADSGKDRWQTDTDQDLSTPAAIHDGFAYICDWTIKIHVVDLSTGVIRYTTSIGSGQITGATVANDMLYVGDNDGTLYAKDINNNGKTEWTYSDGNSAIPRSPVVTPDYVYLWDEDVGIRALRREDRSTAWTFADDFLSLSEPAMANNSLYVGSALGKLYVLEGAEGELLDFVDVGSLIYSPAVAQDTVVFGTQDGTVYGVRSSV